MQIQTFLWMNYYWKQNLSIKQLEVSNHSFVRNILILPWFWCLLDLYQFSKIQEAAERLLEFHLPHVQNARLDKKGIYCSWWLCVWMLLHSHLSLLQEWFLQRCTYANYSSTNKGSLHKMKGNMKADTVQYFKNSNNKIFRSRSCDIMSHMISWLFLVYDVMMQM